MILADQISEKLTTILATSNFRPDQDWANHNPMIRSLQWRFRSNEIVIDILCPRDGHDRRAFDNRRKKLFRGRYVWFPSPEDLILQKLKVGRPQDFSDAAGILRRSGKHLDEQYLERWAKKLGNHRRTPSRPCEMRDDLSVCCLELPAIGGNRVSVITWRDDSGARGCSK